MNRLAQKAISTVKAFAASKGLLDDQCKFIPGEEWEGEYGRNSIAVILYEGSNLAYACSMDSAYELGCMAADAGSKCDPYAALEALQSALRVHGLYMEECTNCYAAIYKI